MKTIIKQSPVILSGKKAGVNIVRDKSNVLVVFGKPEIGQLKYNIDIDSSGKKTTSNIKKQVRPYYPKTRRKLKSNLEDKELPTPIPCEYQGLIIATKNGHSLVVIDPDYRQKSFILWLGNNPQNTCIVDNVGNVERFTSNGYISNFPARWAFKDNFRKILIGSKFDTINLYPFIGRDKQENFTQQYREKSLLPHYSYSIKIPDSSDDWAALADLSGAVFNITYSWFSENAAGIADEDQGHSGFFDAPGWDMLDFGDFTEKPSFRYMPLPEQQECTGMELISGDSTIRLHQLHNYERVCVIFVDIIKQDSECYTLASYYAQRMAQYDFISHTDPIDGSDLSVRAANFGIEYQDIAEVLASVPDPGITDPDKNLDAVCDAVFDAWKGSPVHYDILVSSLYFRAAIEVAYSASSNKWYACGILRVISSDQPNFDLQPIYLPQLPDVSDGIHNDPIFFQYGKGNLYRGFCTIPRQELYISCLGRQWWEGTVTIAGTTLLTRVKDCDEYLVSSPDKIEGHTFPTPDIGDKTFDSSYALFNCGGWIRNNIDDRDFYIQWDNITNRHIKITLEALGEGTDTFTTKSEDYVYRTSPLLSEGEEEPNLTTDQTTGNSSLYVGNLLVDHARRLYKQGSFINPYQSIMVSSVFYSNSGYIVLTYTIPKTLNSECWKWLDNNGKTVYEKYFWMKQELWCAVINPNGSLVARWRLGGINPGEDDNIVYSPTEIVTHQDSAQQEFIINFDGEIKIGSVVVNCLVGTYPIVLTDNGEGGLTEAEYQNPNYQTVVSTSEILYEQGVVTITFSSNRPDQDSDIVTNADVGNIGNLYKYYEQFSEVVMYADYDSFVIPYIIESAGIAPTAPSSTITEDGRYVVFGSRSAKMLMNRNSFLPIGKNLDNYVSGSFEWQYDFGKSAFQVVVFDLNQIQSEVPAMVTEPRFITNETTLTECMVLN